MIVTKNLKKEFDEETKICIKDTKFEVGKTYAILGASGSR